MVESRLLHFSEAGDGPPLIILHGLFGSGKNWNSLSKVFARKHKVYTVDLRNHGHSFHDATMDYPGMANDVYRLLQSLGISSCGLIGHSMGGKTGIMLSKLYPDLVARLLVADIAPVTYQHEYDHLLDPLMAINLTQVSSRSDVEQLLRADIPDSQLRNFLVQNLIRVDGSWQWKINLPAIKSHIGQLAGFPGQQNDWRVNTPTCFLKGANSGYIGQQQVAAIGRHFSDVTIETIPDAGHWLHAEQPVSFVEHVEYFFGS